MAIRPSKIARRPVEEEEDYEDLADELDDDEEEEAPAPKKKAAPAVAKRTARPIIEDEDDEDEEDYDDDDEEDEPAPVKKKVVPPAAPAKKVVPGAKKVAPAVPAKKASKPVVEDDEDEDEAPAPVKVKSITNQVVDDLIPNLMAALEEGKAITITKIAENKWQVHAGAAKVVGQKLSAKDYEATVYNPEYLKWQEGWKVMTQAEKVATAKKMGVTYPAHKDPRVEAIGLAEAVMEHLGLTKYKPEYEKPSVRRALRGK